MVNAITQLVKYLNIIFIGLYSFCALRVLTKKNPEKQKRYYLVITIILFLIHGINFLVLIMSTNKLEIVFFYVIQVLTLILFMCLYKIFYKNMSELVFLNMFALIIIGLIMQTRLSFEDSIWHFLYIVAGLAICLIVPKLIEKLKFFSYLGYLYMLIGLILLALLLVLGSQVYGATNWLVIGKFRFQPSELVKLLYVFGIAGLFRKKQSLSTIVVGSILAAGHCLILVLERDLGAALLFFITYIIMLYGATGKSIYLALGLASGTGAAVLAYFLFPHVRIRVEAFVDPLTNYMNSGYQVTQSLFAISSGGWFGTGFNNGYPGYIPVVKSDFVFSAIVEEMGGIFAICVILICISCFIMFINMTLKLNNRFYKLASLGFGVMYIFQVFLNIGGVIKFIPSTGVTLPLISTGGSSILVTIMMFSIIQGMYVLREKEISSKEFPGNLNTEKDNATNRFLVFNKKGIYAITYGLCLVLVATACYLTYFISFKSTDFSSNDYNKRLDHIAEDILRGKILSSDGKVLAESLVDEDGNEYRYYPYNKMFAHVVGRSTYGSTGIESSENTSLLTNSVNEITMILDEMANTKKQGDNVISTLNYELQKVAYDALGDNQGAVVIMEPKTGRILAMVSKPDYNPNKVEENWDKLIENEKSPLLNRAIKGLYPPGSTFKIFTALEYIRENKDYKNFYFECEGKTRVNDVTINCASNIVHGKEDLKEAFANSCNSAFANLGATLNMDGLKSLCEEFLFNTQLPGELGISDSSFVLDGASDKIDIPQTVIGLGKTQITPIHNALIISAIANDGKLMIPYVVDKIQNYKGHTVKSYEPKSYGNLIDANEAKLLKEYLEEVVKTGTGSKLANKSYTSAGKTGTATYEIGKNPHAWYIGYAPCDDPQIAVSIILETAGSGSAKAVPVAVSIFDKFFSLTY